MLFASWLGLALRAYAGVAVVTNASASEALVFHADDLRAAADWALLWLMFEYQLYTTTLALEVAHLNLPLRAR